MPNNQDTLVDKLEDIGDAIRAKTGKSDKLTLSQMPTEIGSISGGGGDDYLTWYNALCKTSSGPVDWSIDFDQEYIPAFSNYFGQYTTIQLKLTKCNLPNLKKVADNAFRVNAMNSKTINYMELPEVTGIGANAFTGFYVTTLSLPKCQTINSFSGSYVLNYYLPLCSSLPNTCFNNSSVWTVYLSAISEMGGNTASSSPFRMSTSIAKLIIDNETPPTLNSYLTNYAHNNSSNRFYSGSAKIYVPRAALSDYESATNWSVYYAAGNILAIEDSETDLMGIFPELDEKMGW